jgi:hypothetical protein
MQETRSDTRLRERGTRGHGERGMFNHSMIQSLNDSISHSLNPKKSGKISVGIGFGILLHCFRANFCRRGMSHEQGARPNGSKDRNLC